MNEKIVTLSLRVAREKLRAPTGKRIEAIAYRWKGGFMGDNVNLVFSEERQTWNVIVNGEWYYESSNYEHAENIFNSFFWNDEYDEPEYDDFEERW